MAFPILWGMGALGSGAGAAAASGGVVVGLGLLASRIITWGAVMVGGGLVLGGLFDAAEGALNFVKWAVALLLAVLMVQSGALRALVQGLAGK